jgi:hypothetical protein
MSTKPNSGKPFSPGWFMAGSKPNHYEGSLDTSEAHSGSQCAYMKHAVAKPEGFGTLMQQFSPNDYLGKRLKISLFVKTQDLEGRVQPWMRVDGPERGKTLSFDNMCNRAISENTDWKGYSMVLNVPEESTNIAFGVMLFGKGKMWFDDVTVDVVGDDVEVTDCPCSHRKKHSGPRNLKFEES